LIARDLIHGDVLATSCTKTHRKNRDQHHNKSIARFLGIYNIRFGLGAGRNAMYVDATRTTKNPDEKFGWYSDPNVIDLGVACRRLP
jgi:hypothetical protein